MTRTGVGQTLIAGTVIWGVCFLAPLTTIVKYLAYLVVYPDVSLTWLDMAGYIPDLRVFLQTSLFASLSVLYLGIWWLWSGRNQISIVLKPPVCTLKQGYERWCHVVACTQDYLNSIIYQRDIFALNDKQKYARASMPDAKMRGVSSLQPFRTVMMHNVLMRLEWKTCSWRVVSSKVYHLHVRVHAFIWRVMSCHIRLHMRIWLLAIEWMFCRFVSRRVLSAAGTHLDVIQQHKVKVT